MFADAIAARGDELVEWRPAEADPPELDGLGAALVFGGGMHVDQEGRHPWLRTEKQLLAELLGRGTAMLGVCLGAQLVAEVAGGGAREAPLPEIGWQELELTPDAGDDPLVGRLPDRFTGFCWHSYEVVVPPGAVRLARSERFLHAYRLGERVWGVQWHAEVTPESIGRWLDDYGEDARRARVDADAVREQTESLAPPSNELGRGLCRRFLDLAD